MFKIALCDDDLEFLQQIESSIKSYFFSRRTQLEITTYNSGEALVADTNKTFDMLFLDIQMAQLNGLEVASILRKRGCSFLLVFISAMPDYARFGFEHEAFRYLIKPELETTLVPCLDAICQRLELQNASLEFSFVGNARQVVALEDIIYLEGQGHKILFHLQSKSSEENCPYLLRKRMDTIEQEFKYTGLFLRIHKSFLVNMQQIRSMSNNTAFLKNGQSLPVSSKRYKTVSEEFMLYKGKK